MTQRHFCAIIREGFWFFFCFFFVLNTLCIAYILDALVFVTVVFLCVGWKYGKIQPHCKDLIEVGMLLPSLWKIYREFATHVTVNHYQIIRLVA